MNAPVGMVSWIYSIGAEYHITSGDNPYLLKCDRVPQTIWTDPTLRVPQLSDCWTYSTNNLQSAPVLGGTGHTPMVVGLRLRDGRDRGRWKLGGGWGEEGGDGRGGEGRGG